MFDSYLGLSPLIWKGIFSFLNVFIVGLLLALFATKYQKRKEVEIQIEGEILKLRLKAYERINIFLGRLHQHIAPPAYQEVEYEVYLDGFNFWYIHPEFAKCFNSEKEFDSFYADMENLIIQEHPYLDFDVEVKLRDSLATLTHLKLILDAFTDMEHLEKHHFSMEVAQQHIDMAYRLTGIAMQKEVNGIYCKMDKQIAKRLRNITLSYGEPKFSKWWHNVRERFFEHLDRGFYTGGWKKRLYWLLARTAIRKRAYMGESLPKLILMLMYVHYSEQYSRDEFDDELDDDKREQLMREFYKDFMMLYYH